MELIGDGKEFIAHMLYTLLWSIQKEWLLQIWSRVLNTIFTVKNLGNVRINA